MQSALYYSTHTSRECICFALKLDLNSGIHDVSVRVCHKRANGSATLCGKVKDSWNSGFKVITSHFDHFEARPNGDRFGVICHCILKARDSKHYLVAKLVRASSLVFILTPYSVRICFVLGRSGPEKVCPCKLYVCQRFQSAKHSGVSCARWSWSSASDASQCETTTNNHEPATRRTDECLGKNE